MTSQLARIAASYVCTLILPASLFLLLRGHNAPGGGFIAGLVAGSGFFFHAVARGPASGRKFLRVRPVSLSAAGLFLCLAAAGTGAVIEGALLKSYWLQVDAALLGRIKAGTPMLFDTGVFLAVTGGFLLIVLTLIEEYQWK